MTAPIVRQVGRAALFSLLAAGTMVGSAARAQLQSGLAEPVCDAHTLADWAGPGNSSPLLPAHNRSTAYVVLSPRMPYALPHANRMMMAARLVGFEVVALRDPRVPFMEWTAAVEAANLPELRALPPADVAAAQRCHLLNHAPAAIVQRCGVTHPWPVLGVMPSPQWSAVLQARRADLERVLCY